jgi:hypothetical protein
MPVMIFRNFTLARSISTIGACLSLGLACLPALTARAEEPAPQTEADSITVDPQIMPVSPPPVIMPQAPVLKGKLLDVTIKDTTSGSQVKVMARLRILNAGTKTANAVKAAVYLSSSSKLTSTAEPIATLDLSSFYKNGKLGPDDTKFIPLKYKLSSLIAPSLTGKYLVIVLSAGNFPAKDGKPVVYGPLPKLDPPGKSGIGSRDLDEPAAQ